MAPADQSDSMLGHHDEYVPVGGGAVCHLRTVQVGFDEYKLFMCPLAKQYLKDHDIANYLQGNPAQVLANLKRLLLESVNIQNRLKQSYGEVLKELSQIGFDKLISFDGANVSMKGPHGSTIVIDLCTMADGIVKTYEQLCKINVDERETNDIISLLKQHYYTARCNGGVQVYISEGNTLQIVLLACTIHVSGDTTKVITSKEQLVAYLDSIGATQKLSVTDKDNCGICMTIEDEDLPDHGCTTCHRSFHTRCLLDWMRSSEQSRTAFGHISCPCPWDDCTNTLSIKI